MFLTFSLHQLENYQSDQEADEELNDGVDPDETGCEDSEDQVGDGDNQHVRPDPEKNRWQLGIRISFVVGPQNQESPR